MPLFHSLHSHSNGKSDTNNGGDDDVTAATTLRDQRTDDISSNVKHSSKVIPIIESLPLRTRHDFQLLESKIQKWKESQVGPI